MKILMFQGISQKIMLFRQPELELFGLKYYLEKQLIISIYNLFKLNLETIRLQNLTSINPNEIVIYNPSNSVLRDIDRMFPHLTYLRIKLSV